MTIEEGNVAETAIAPVQADEVSTALAEVTKTNTTITSLIEKGRELSTRYQGVVADVRTVKGYDQIAEIRKELREEVRYPMQKLQKEGSKLLGTMQRQFNQRAEELIAEAEGFERPFHEMLQAEDQRKANEKAEREAAEARRKQAHVDAINAINKMALDAVGMESAQLEAQLEAARGIIVDEGYEEFQGQALQAKDEAVRQLTGMLLAARAEEAERAEIEETRRKQAEFAEQQRVQREAAEAAAAEARAKQEAAERETAQLRERLAAMEREQAAQREEQERAARERAQAIESRINSLKGLLAETGEDGSGAEELAQALEVIRNKAAAADFPALYGDRADEARQLTASTIAHFEGLVAKAQAREAEEAAAAQRARREELLANIIGMGDSALLAVQDGSADVAELQRNLKTIEELVIDVALVGDRIEEFVLARDVAISKAMDAIEQTKERDRLRAEEEEAQRKRDAEAREAMELQLRKRMHSEELYQLVRTALVGDWGGEQWDIQARALLLKINPAETFED